MSLASLLLIVVLLGAAGAIGYKLGARSRPVQEHHVTMTLKRAE